MRQTGISYLLVGVAGAMGALSRYGLGSIVADRFAPPFPVATLVVNVAGSFLLGLVAGMGAGRGLIPPAWRTPLAVGFLGSFTTFSTWTVDTMQLAEQGRPVLAAVNVTVSLGLGLAAVWSGLSLGRRAQAWYWRSRRQRLRTRSGQPAPDRT